MENCFEQSERILSKLLKDKKFMKFDLNKLVHNIDCLSDTEDEEDTEEREDYYDIKKNGYWKRVYFKIPAKTTAIKSN